MFDGTNSSSSPHVDSVRFKANKICIRTGTLALIVINTKREVVFEPPKT